MSSIIRVEAVKDSICLVNNDILVVVNSKEYIYGLSSVNKMVLFTTDLGPSHDDMGLTIDVGNSDEITIMSEHRCFSPFLFDQIGKALPIDFQKIIDASTCTVNGVFELYVKKG